MNLTQISNLAALIDNLCLTSRMQEALTCLRIILCCLLKPHTLHQTLHNTLHGKEISLTVHSKSKLHLLLWKLGKRQSLWKIDIGKLIETYVLITAVIVCCE